MTATTIIITDPRNSRSRTGRPQRRMLAVRDSHVVCATQFVDNHPSAVLVAAAKLHAKAQRKGVQL